MLIKSFGLKKIYKQIQGSNKKYTTFTLISCFIHGTLSMHSFMCQRYGYKKNHIL